MQAGLDVFLGNKSWFPIVRFLFEFRVPCAQCCLEGKVSNIGEPGGPLELAKTKDCRRVFGKLGFRNEPVLLKENSRLVRGTRSSCILISDVNSHNWVVFFFCGCHFYSDVARFNTYKDAFRCRWDCTQQRLLQSVVCIRAHSRERPLLVICSCFPASISIYGYAYEWTSAGVYFRISVKIKKKGKSNLTTQRHERQISQCASLFLFCNRRSQSRGSHKNMLRTEVTVLLGKTPLPRCAMHAAMRKTNLV